MGLDQNQSKSWVIIYFVIGAVVLTLLPEMMRSLQDYRMLIYAVVLIGVMLFTWSPKAKDFREKYSLKRLLKKDN